MTEYKRKNNGNSFNRPQWKHQPIRIKQFNTEFSISEDGKVTICVTSPDPDDQTKEVLDMVTVPAGLIFKIASYLKDTREAVKVESVISKG